MENNHHTTPLLGALTCAHSCAHAVAHGLEEHLSKAAAAASLRFPVTHEVVPGGTVPPANQAAVAKGAAAKTLPPPVARMGDQGVLPLKPWRGVFFDGPQSDQDQEGEEIPVWFVYVGDEEAEPVGKTYTCLSFNQAEALAQRMAKDRRLELIQEAMPA